VLVDLAAWQIGLGFIIVGAAALYLSAKWEGKHGPSPLDLVLREGGALLFVTATLTVVWDLRGRRQLTNEVLSAAELSSEIANAGLTRVTTHYADIDWNDLLNRASHVDLFFAYAATWRAYHDAALRRLVSREGARLRVVLPDRRDAAQIAQLATRFGASTQEIVQKITDAERAFTGLASASEHASVELRVTRAFPVFTYYRFDGRCVGVLYAQAGERVEVPAFECQHGGALYKFFSNQFKVLWEGAAAPPVEHARDASARLGHLRRLWHRVHRVQRRP
jgi:hypothetical protein